MLRAAIVGCGFMGRMHANVYRLIPSIELVSSVDHNADKAASFAEEFGCRPFTSLESALAGEDIDAVDVCLPTFLHKEYTVMAANAGKHVFCEKPIALNLADADAMISACDSASVRLMIGHCIRFWPEYTMLKQLRDGGSMGKLLSINLTRYGEFPHWASDNWMAHEEKAGGGALDMHIHDTDFALYLLGEPIQMESFGTEDERGVGHIFTTMQFADGVVAHLEGGWNLPPHTPFKMAFRAVFERGAAIMDGGPMTIYEHGRDPIVPSFQQMSAQGGGNISDLGGYYHELREFADCILEDRPFTIVTPQTSRRSLEVVLEEIRKVRQRRA
jgi:predicted dehydrogenase